MLELSRVDLAYTSGEVITYALKDASLRLGEREFLGVVGPSGSGKSSLLYVLSGLKPPSSGRVLYRGAELSRMSRSSLCSLRRTEFGFIFQQHFLIHYLTALENVVVAAPRPNLEARRRAIGRLDRLGLAAVANKFPHQLSVGQRQRVAVARAFLHEPQVVFADEPTASLDRAGALQVIAALEAYHADGHAVVVVTHDPSILRNADQVVQVWDGRVEPAPQGGVVPV